MFRYHGRIVAGLALLLVSGAGAQAQTLRVSNLNAPSGKGDPTTSLSYQHTYTFEAIFDTLTAVRGDGKPAASLAESWTNKDPLTWTFKLKPGVTFHTGTPLTADVIVFAVKNLQSDEQKKLGAPVYGSLSHVIEATKVDDMTVEIKTSRPAPILPAETSAFRIVDPKAWADLGRENFGTRPSGTGPFRVTAWDNTQATMVRFDGGFRKPKIDNMLMYFQPEAATRVQAFNGGAVDLAFSIPTDSVELVKKAGGTINVGTAPSVSILVFNQKKGGFTTDKRVRQALNYAIDKSYGQTLLGGYGKPAGQPATASVNGYQPDIGAYPYDPAKAKQLLSEAGFPNGLKVVAEIVDTNADLTNVYQKVAQDLAKVGVNMELRLITLPDLFAKVTGGKEFEGEMHIMNYGSNPSGDMMRSINAFHSCNSASKWTCVPEAQAAIEAANAEFDPAKRSAELRKIALAYHDAAPQIFLFEQYELDATTAKVKGFRNQNWLISWADIELAR